MIATTLGPLDETLLLKREGEDETDDAVVRWVEYRLPDDKESLLALGLRDIIPTDEIIHRSAHADLKRGIDFGVTGEGLNA